MGNNAVNESVEIPIEEEGISDGEHVDTFSQVIRQIGETLFDRYDEKTSNLTDENILGIIRIKTLNDYMEERYGPSARYTSLDTLAATKMNLVISRRGYGFDKFIEALQSIQAQFQNAELSPSIGQQLLQRRH
jgi:hypothetical protein